jgi:DNA-binding NarL/FixJ family response regulator
MPIQNVQIPTDLANIEPEHWSTVGRSTAHARIPGRTLTVGLSNHALDEAAHLRLPASRARLHEVTVEPDAMPSDHRLLATTILIVDDCTLYRENLAVALASNEALAAHVAWDMASLISTLETCTPDVVLLSMSTKDSTALLRTMTASRPDVKVIAVGVWEGDEPTIVACAENGVTGYHLRDESFEDLVLLIDKVIDGDSVCSPRVAAILLRRLSKLASERQPDTGELVLTAREIQILRMLEMGLSNREIANELCIALHTVKNHVHSVLGKLGVSTRAQAVAVSRSMRFPEPSPRDLGTEPV